ncbi:hypothetical protein Tco_1346261 [Tanacetum coccineum]
MPEGGLPGGGLPEGGLPGGGLPEGGLPEGGLPGGGLPEGGLPEGGLPGGGLPEGGLPEGGLPGGGLPEGGLPEGGLPGGGLPEEVKGWLDEDLDNYHLKELRCSTQCHTQMSMWIISRGVVLLILLMLGISFKFGISGLLHQVITTIADRIRDKDTSQSKQNLQSSSMTFIHKTLIIPSVLDSCFNSSTVCEVKRTFAKTWGFAFIHYEAWDVLKNHHKWSGVKADVPKKHVRIAEDIEESNELFQDDTISRPYGKPRPSKSQKSNSSRSAGSSST